MNLWLGTQRGYLSDWFTQQWVRATGLRVLAEEHAWLDAPWGPAGSTMAVARDAPKMGSPG